ncbi:P-selectin-like [Macrobrachium nipponense]|uniref:P-selectin-like n=1 Tax=Macrobrachium nipponense TaxID=159736 RepID=UPI0030C836DD
MLLSALVLFTIAVPFTLARIERANQEASFTKGINEIASVLDEYQRRCSVKLSDKLEEKLRDLTNTTEMQWKVIQTLQENVTKAIVRTDELIEYNQKISPTPVPDLCAWPFKRVAGSCFWIHKNPSLTWEKARAFCQQEGGDLATPQDIGAVIRFLNRELSREWLFVWFGGKKRHDSWYWLSGERQMNVSREYWSDYDR